MYNFTPETSLFSGAATLSRRPRLDGRIADGELAIIEDYPHQVNLRLSTTYKDGIRRFDIGVPSAVQ
jgi:hypothetical protein